MSLYRFEPWQFDTERGLLLAGEDELHVRHKVAELLTFLIENRHRIVSKDELLTRLWLHGEYRENSLTQSIREARRLLGDSAQSPSYIKNYPQRGYQWIAEVQLLSSNGMSVPANEVADTAENQPTESITSSKHSALYVLHKWWPVLLLIALCIGYLGYAAINQQSSETTQLHQQQRLMVLPFVNNTGDNSLQWMELGLSDMLASALARQSDYQVISPAASHSLLALSALKWPIEPSQLKELMVKQKLSDVLYSEVSLYRGQQVLSVKLYRRDGSVRGGSISYPKLLTAANAVAGQILQLINPQQVITEIAASPVHPASAQDFTRGVHAMQKQGAFLAGHYFGAAIAQDAQNQWAQAYRGMTAVLLGHWQEAQQVLATITTVDDLRLNLFVCRWWAEIDFRRGLVSEAERRLLPCAEKAEQQGHLQLAAQSYRVLARISHQRLDWSAFRQHNQQAVSLATGDELSIQAERLFYLGNPVESGLEKDPFNDLQQNSAKVKTALTYFTGLANQPMIAASQFAVAQNYRLPLTEREAALAEAIQLWRQLNMPYELAQALTYQGFYFLQLHQGARAVEPLQQAIKLTDQLGARWLHNLSRFYRAFADLDMGLDQGNGADPVALERALLGFDRILALPDLMEKERADSYVLRGWALSELGRYQQAIESQQQARDYYRKHNLHTSFGYAVYSMMWDLLQLGRNNEVIALADQPIKAELQLRYLAEAHHRLRDYDAAQEVFERIRQLYPASWSDQDEARYQQYLHSPQLGLGPLPGPHLVYCETDWLLADSAINQRD